MYCNNEIFSKGKPIALLDARSDDAEDWVCLIAFEANALVDWHYSGGIAQVLYLGSEDDYNRIKEAIIKNENKLVGKVLKVIDLGSDGLYRSGVTEVPDNVIGGFMDPLTGNQVFIKDK